MGYPRGKGWSSPSMRNGNVLRPARGQGLSTRQAVDEGIFSRREQMINFPGYDGLTTIYEGPECIVYRAVRRKDARPVVLKVLKKDFPTVEELTRYKREYEITSFLNRLGIQGVIAVYGLEEYDNALAIVFEDFGGESLSKGIASGSSPSKSRSPRPVKSPRRSAPSTRPTSSTKTSTPPTSFSTARPVRSGSSTSATQPACHGRTRSSEIPWSSKGPSPTSPRSRPAG